MTIFLDLPDALEAAGVNVRVLDGWDTPAKPGYYWREDDGDPAGAMHHHTATTAYTPNRDKANGYAGLSMNGSDRLYQEDYGDGDFQPVYTIANGSTRRTMEMETSNPSTPSQTPTQHLSVRGQVTVEYSTMYGRVSKLSDDKDQTRQVGTATPTTGTPSTSSTEPAHP